MKSIKLNYKKLAWEHFPEHTQLHAQMRAIYIERLKNNKIELRPEIRKH